MGEAFIGVDVGTGSARAGVFDGRRPAARQRPRGRSRSGAKPAKSSNIPPPTSGRPPARPFARRSSGRDVEPRFGRGARLRRHLLAGRARRRRAARCRSGRSGDPDRDTIVWMDHRAVAEAAEINAGGHEVLRYVGGAISPEMQSPKLLWLARHLPRHLCAAGAFSRSDRLPHLSRDRLARALRLHGRPANGPISAHERRWSRDFFESVGLGALGGGRLSRASAPRSSSRARRSARGLTREAAAAMGLRAGVPVGAGLIDAHAGAFGTIGGAFGADAQPIRRSRLALILGTSACCMALSDAPRFHTRRLGAVLFRADSRPMADRGRPERLRRGDRPSDAHASRARALGRRISRRWSAKSSRAPAARRRRRCSPATCTCCPISSATARRSPTPARAARLSGSISPTTRRACARSMSRASAASRRASAQIIAVARERRL